MGDTRDRIVEYKFAVDWKIYDVTGNMINSGSDPFETKTEAEKYAEKIKKETPYEHNAIINIRELNGNQIIRQYKKKSGRVNFRRR